MEATVAAPTPNSLPATSSLNKNTASQPPPREINAAQESPQNTNDAPRTVTVTSERVIVGNSHIVTAAQKSLDRAIAAAQATPRNLVAEKSTEAINHNHQIGALATQPSLSQPVIHDSGNLASAQNSLEKGFSKYIPQQTIVTPQGTWQNVTAPSIPEHTLPAVQNFLLKAFETVQRSKQMAMTATNNSMQNVTQRAPLIPGTPIVQNPIPIAFVTMPVLPNSISQQPPPLLAVPRAPNPNSTTFVTRQISSPAPFKSLHRMNSHPPSNQDTSKLKSAFLDKTPFTLKQTMTTQQASTKPDQTPNTSEIKSSSINQCGISKSQSYPGYVFYNTALQNPKQSSPKRSVLVAKRQNPAVKINPGKPEDSVQSPVSEILLASLVPKGQKLTPEKSNTEQKSNPVVENSSRVAQTFREFKRGHVLQPSQAKGKQNAQATAGASNRNWRQQNNNEDNEEVIIDPKIRVLASGFPAYTQSQDLIRVLSRFGKCQVDSCRNRLAVVTFESEREAKSAIAATNEINIYGEFVEIKPYTNPKHVDDLYKAFKKVLTTQKGPDIKKPTEIDLTGDFFNQMENIQNAIRLTREQAQAINNLYGDLEMVLQQEWPGCVAIPFGSIPTGLGIKSSDADCYVELPEPLRARGANGGAATFVTRARRLLQQYPKVFTHLLAIPRANTPIVKFRHVPSGFHCDVSAKTPLGAQNSKLIKLLLEHDERLAHIAVLIKYWAKVHELSGTGKLTNYALTMMVIFYLQQPTVGLVPAVERLQRDPSTRYIVDHWNAGFCSRKLPGTPNSASVPELLGGFFEFYAGFDFEKLVVCPYLGYAVPKASFENPHTLPLELSRYVGNIQNNLAGPIRYTTQFCVQDPFEQSHNVASSVCPKLADEIRAFIKFAADTYAADRVNDCRNFLRTILLTRPKLKPERVTPSTVVSLVPRVRLQNTEGDWRAIVREIIIDVIFKKILKLQVECEKKKEVRKRRPARIEIGRERYSGAASKPVWRRRKASRIEMLLPETPEQLITRQAALTDEVLSSAQVAILKFQIELWFREEPKNCNLSFKMLDGDMDAFRQFVSFLHTFMLDWFRVLLGPHMVAKDPNQAVTEAVESTGKTECTIKFEREPARDPSPPRLVLDTDITRDLSAVTLEDDNDSDSSDSSQKEPR